MRTKLGKEPALNRLDPRRLATVLLAPTAALAAWGILRTAGLDLVLKDGLAVGPGAVVAAALVGALAAWAVVHWLEVHHGGSARAVWAFVGSTALAVSVIGPSWRADGASAVALIGLHCVTAIVVIVGLGRTLPPDDRAATRTTGDREAQGRATRAGAVDAGGELDECGEDRILGVGTPDKLVVEQLIRSRDPGGHRSVRQVPRDGLGEKHDRRRLLP